MAPEKFTLLLSSAYLITSICGAQVIGDLSNELQKTTLSRFDQLKEALFAEPYSQLPAYAVDRKIFGPSGNNENNNLLIAARRTFEEKADLIDFPSEQKVLNANGICFAGRWLINQDNPYSGLYENGVESPVIVRGSVALSGTQQKDQRAFGMAIKLLPDDLGDRPSLNIFVLHSMGGTKTKHVLDLTVDNQPPLGRLPRLRDLGTALRLRKDLERADKESGAENPTVSFRPVSELAYYEQTKSSITNTVALEAAVASPKWLRLTPITQMRIDQDDFRDELRVEQYPNRQIIYQIDVAADSVNGKKSNAQWQTIGELLLTSSVTSAACDKQLHFKHPRLVSESSE